MRRGGWGEGVGSHSFPEENQGTVIWKRYSTWCLGQESQQERPVSRSRPAPRPAPCRPKPHTAGVTGARGGSGAGGQRGVPAQEPWGGGSSPCRVLQQQQRPRARQDHVTQTRGPRRAVPSACRAESLGSWRRLHHTGNSQQGPVPKTSGERWPGGLQGRGGLWRWRGEPVPRDRGAHRAGSSLPPAAEPPW